jgi:ribose transport system permease protein
MLAVYVLATGVKGMQLITGAQWLNDMFNGVALIGAVAFAVWRQGKAGGRRRFEVRTAAPGPPRMTVRA